MKRGHDMHAVSVSAMGADMSCLPFICCYKRKTWYTGKTNAAYMLQAIRHCDLEYTPALRTVSSVLRPIQNRAKSYVVMYCAVWCVDHITAQYGRALYRMVLRYVVLCIVGSERNGMQWDDL